MTSVPRGGTAVMARRVEPPDSLDFFPTPPWATRALCEHVLPYAVGRRPGAVEGTVWEPACGAGDMARPLAEYFAHVHASDVHPYGHGEVADFLWPSLDRGTSAADGPVDWVITNPPFRLGLQFVLRARRVARAGVAMLVRMAFLESIERYEGLFRQHPPTIGIFTERVPMFRGRLDPAGSTATAYVWLVWSRDVPPKAPLWIPPCRKTLERPDDYPTPPALAPSVDPLFAGETS